MSDEESDKEGGEEDDRAAIARQIFDGSSFDANLMTLCCSKVYFEILLKFFDNHSKSCFTLMGMNYY